MWSLKIKTNIIINIAKIYYVSRAYWQLIVFLRKLCLLKVVIHRQQSPESMGNFPFMKLKWSRAKETHSFSPF